MSNTKHTPEAKYSLTRLSEEHTSFLETFATIVNVNGQRWYNLPFWYRKESGYYFEILPPDKVPKEVKSFQPSENQSLLEALKDVAELWEEELPLDLTTYNKVKNAIQNAENQ